MRQYTLRVPVQIKVQESISIVNRVFIFYKCVARIHLHCNAVHLANAC